MLKQTAKLKRVETLTTQLLTDSRTFLATGKQLSDSIKASFAVFTLCQATLAVQKLRDQCMKDEGLSVGDKVPSFEKVRKMINYYLLVKSCDFSFNPDRNLTVKSDHDSGVVSISPKTQNNENNTGETGHDRPESKQDHGADIADNAAKNAGDDHDDKMYQIEQVIHACKLNIADVIGWLYDAMPATAQQVIIEHLLETQKPSLESMKALTEKPSSATIEKIPANLQQQAG